MATNLADSVCLMNMVGQQNIVIQGNKSTFQMNKSFYTGEHNHIFNMLGAVNVSLYDLNAIGAGGDGFYIGETAGTYIPSQNIKMFGCKADNSRRNGMSIASVSGLYVDENCLFNNSNGTSPQLGIDIEPNAPRNKLEGIVIKAKTSNNVAEGIGVSLLNMGGSTNVVDIKIENHIDDGSSSGLRLYPVTSAFKGKVTIVNPVWKNNLQNGFMARNYQEVGARVELQNPTVIDCNKSASTAPNYGSAYLIHREGTDTTQNRIGNVHLFNPNIINSGSILNVTAFYVKDNVSGQDGYAENVSLINPISIDGTRAIDTRTYFWVINGLVKDEYDVTKYLAAGSSFIIDGDHYKRIFSNKGYGGANNFVLPTALAGFSEMTFVVENAFTLTITPDANSNILPISSVVGKTISSNTVGNRVTLKRLSSTQWMIKEMIGTWTVQP